MATATDDDPKNGVCGKTNLKTDCQHEFPHCLTCLCSDCDPTGWEVVGYTTVDGEQWPILMRKNIPLAEA